MTSTLGMHTGRAPVSFRRTIARNLVVQAVGPACSFLTIVAIARFGGPAEQGAFAQLKAWTDLVVVLGCIGLPQGYIVVINQFGAPAGTVARWSKLYSWAFVPIGLLGSVIALSFGLFPIHGAGSFESAVVLTLAAALLILQLLWRGVYLTRYPRIPFALFTIIPAVTLFLSSTVATLLGWRRFDYIILAAAVATVLVSSQAMRPILREPETIRYRDLPWRALLSNGLHSFIQGILGAAQPMLAYTLLRFLGGGSRDAGFLNTGLFLVQGLAVPISMAAPLLFERWTRSSDNRLIERLHALMLPSVGIGAALGILLAFAAQYVIPLLFGPEYGNAIRSTQAMLLTLPLLCFVRVVAPALHARSRPDINTNAGIARVVAFGMGMFLLHGATGSIVGAAGTAWALAEVVAAFWTLFGLRALFLDGRPRSAIKTS